jgi:signal transduction histidine kinase
MLGTPRRAYAGRVMDRSLPALLRRPVAADLAMTAALAGLALGLGWSMIAKFGDNWKMIYALGSAAAWHRVLIAWWLATAVGLAALPMRRRFPLAVFGATLAMAAVHYSDPAFGLSPADLAVPIALYSLAAAAPRRISLAGLGGGVALATIAAALIGGSLGTGWLEQPSYITASGLALAAAWFAGDGSRTRRAYLAEVERRASDAERDRDRQAELAVAAERSRITGELHDVIAHALSVMVIQAQGAGSALRRRHPDQTGAALDAIVATGRDALAETRMLLGVVHQPGDQEAALAPQPSLAGVGQLVDQVRQAGARVELRIEGMPRPLAAGVELSAYRIIQEGLTNTIKHAGPSATATVRMVYGEAELVVEITDNGRAAADPGLSPGPSPGPSPAASPGASRSPSPSHGVSPAGFGLSGMRARAAVLGGEVTAGPDTAAGFRVRARLPLTVPVG